MRSLPFMASSGNVASLPLVRIGLTAELLRTHFLICTSDTGRHRLIRRCFSLELKHFLKLPRSSNDGGVSAASVFVSLSTRN
jgi:hypothetical protein